MTALGRVGDDTAAAAADGLFGAFFLFLLAVVPFFRVAAEDEVGMLV